MSGKQTESDSAKGCVVRMFTRRPVETTCFSEVDAYWQGLCDGRLMPLRREIDPRGIIGALDRTFLLERIAPGLARFRLAGAHLSDLMGMEVRGMPVSCLFMPAARAQLSEAIESVFSEPARVDLWLAGPNRLTRGAMAARMLLLPLRDDRGDVTRALGCLSASAPLANPPNRFTITSDMRQTLIGYGIRPARPVAETKQAPRVTGRPKLRVITGGA